MRSWQIAVVWVAILLAFVLHPGFVRAQSFNRCGTEFNAVRTVTVPAGKPYTIVVSEFFHHGEIRPDGHNVIVLGQNKQPVPMRILQIGPGDICRLAFQTVSNQSEYEIYYGGKPPTEEPPPWTCRDGLLLETRAFAPCNMDSLESVRQTFDKASVIGADYVDGVFHNCNPFTLAVGPFLSHYGGYLDIREQGVYGWILSSQDCSFLLIDDKLIASAPGRHGPIYQATPKSRHDVTLAVGEHRFDYYHAAGGPIAMMVVAWEPKPVGEKPRRAITISPNVFRSHLVAHLPANHLTMRTIKQVPDFVATIIGDVPLPDNDVPLLIVTFRDASVKALTMQGAELKWDFGDGQTSELPNVDHVYLQRGVYAVTLSVRRGGKTVKTTNHIRVDRPHSNPKDKAYSLDQCLRIFDDYVPENLDAKSLRQLVLAFEAKSLMAVRQAEQAAQQDAISEEDPNRRPGAKRETPARKVIQNVSNGDAERYLSKAVATGKVAFVGKSAANGDDDLLRLARLIGPMARYALGDSQTAMAIWQGAVERISASPSKAECELTAADIAINDLLKVAEGKALLEAATERIGKNQRSRQNRLLHRVWGDYYAATGDGPAACKSYTEAEQSDGLSRPLVETTALQGAHARSAEEFIRLEQFDRAAEELSAWQRESPGAMADGTMALLFARYWAGRGKHAQAIAQVDRMLAINRNSPYADQLLLVAAESESRRGRKEAAAAILHSLLKDYPGSPLVPLAKQRLSNLRQQEQSKNPKDGKDGL